MLPQHTEIVVIGAGPAGIAAALDLAKLGYAGPIHLVEQGRDYRRRHCPVDTGKKCYGCEGVCNVVAGFGGSIHYGDGVKLSAFPAGRRLQQLLGKTYGNSLMHAAIKLLVNNDSSFTFPAGHEIPFPIKTYPVCVLGENRARTMIENLSNSIAQFPQIKLHLGLAAESIEKTPGGYVVQCFDKRRNTQIYLSSDKVAVAVGRKGLVWWRKELRRLGVNYHPPVPSVGLRFELPRQLLQKTGSIHPDFKTSFVEGGVKVKTFCFCGGRGGGRIKFTDYGNFTLLDGHIVDDARSPSGNFSLLAQLRESDGTPRSFEWIERNLIAPYISLRLDRPGKPLIQWYPDFEAKTMRCASLDTLIERIGYRPSISDYQIADIAKILSPEIHSAFCRVIKRLVQWFDSDSGDHEGSKALQTIGVVGLELENLWDEIDVTRGMETSLPGLYAIGDCAGIAQGILQSTVSGLAFSRGSI